MDGFSLPPVIDPGSEGPSVGKPRALRTLPGSSGEHRLQERYGTTARADRFYQQQVLDYLNPRMRDFLGRQEMMFLATADINALGFHQRSSRAYFAQLAEGVTAALEARDSQFGDYRTGAERGPVEP